LEKTLGWEQEDDAVRRLKMRKRLCMIIAKGVRLGTSGLQRHNAQIEVSGTSSKPSARPHSPSGEEEKRPPRASDPSKGN